MKKINFIILCLLTFNIGNAQSMARIVVSSCGNTATSGATTVHYTVGESVVSYLTSNGNPTYKLSQGFQQSDTIAKSSGEIKKTKLNSKNRVEVSPNPATHIVNVSSVTEMPGILKYTIYNSFGQFCLSVSTDVIVSGFNIKMIDISELAAGLYIIQVSSSDSDAFFVKNIPLLIVN